MRNKDLENIAIEAAEYLKRKLGIKRNINIGIILGTGWGDKLYIENPKSIPFESVPGFSKLQPLEGHSRRFIYGTVAERPVIVLQGRVHLNEDFANPAIGLAVRLQTEILMHLGVRTLIVTCAAGALPNRLPNIHLVPGDLMIMDGFVTLFAPDMPLRAGEFVSPEDALDKDFIKIALKKSKAFKGRIITGGYVMLRGPYFESRKYDKTILGRTGAKAVGMSTLPEACIAALYEAKVLALAFITNDALSAHSHESNMKKAAEFSTNLGNYLTSIVEVI